MVVAVGLLVVAGCSSSPTAPTALPGSASVGEAPQTATPTPPPVASDLVVPPRALGVTRFVAFGDSITYGSLSAFDARFLFDTASAGYPERLLSALTSNHSPQRFTVFNEGVPGELAVNALSRFRTMLTSRRPEAVLLLEGINDLTNEISVSRVGSALGQMLDAAAQAGVPVLIGTMYQTYEVTRPDGSFRDNAAALVPALNAEIRRVATGRLNVHVVDVFGAVRDRSLIGNDGLHPTEQGFAAIAARFLSAIQTAFPVRGSFQ